MHAHSARLIYEKRTTAPCEFYQKIGSGLNLLQSSSRGQPILEVLSISTAYTQTNYAESLAQARDIPVPNDLHTVNIPERIGALCQTLYQLAYSSFLDLLWNLYDKLRLIRQSSKEKMNREVRISRKKCGYGLRGMNGTGTFIS